MNQDYQLSQSGDKQVFETGAQRDKADDKCRPDLVPAHLRMRIGWLLQKGAYEYGANNWLRGIKASRSLQSLHRHLCEAEMGNGPHNGHEDHWAALIFNAMAIMHAQHLDTIGVTDGLYDLRTDPKAPFTADEPGKITNPRPPQPHRIYVAGPYCSDSDKGVQDNVNLAIRIGRDIMKRGHFAHVPHAATGGWHNEFAWGEFMALDLSIIKHWATALFFIGPSPGADLERRFAEKIGLPIFESVDDIPPMELPTIGSREENANTVPRYFGA